MALKKCCIEKCRSCSTRKEDAGVTYHKFPKEASVRATWVEVTRQSCSDVEGINYVCSLHFLKRDFELYQGCKYVLKSGAVPSLFPWTGVKLKKNMDELDSLSVEPCENEKNISTSSKDSEPENLEDIKKYLEKHDKEAKEKIQANGNKSQDINSDNNEIGENTSEPIAQSNKDEPLELASTVIDFVIDESPSKLSTNKDGMALDISTQDCSTKKACSVALSVGSKVEAKDFEECWYSAEIMEVDYDEMEILVRYDSVKKSEEWISVNSPRLRPVSLTPKPTVLVEKLKVKAPELASTKPVVAPVKAPQAASVKALEVAPVIKEKEEMESKAKVTFAVGERCLARWRDNRRFVATVHKVVDEGSYEIIFDDGFFWKCSASRLSKYKDSRSDVSDSPGAGPSTAAVPNPVPFHKHLFDPTRDYLGSKSERREQKRKLNIKEIFNIGQKQKKKEAPAKEEKKDTPKRPRILSKNAPKAKQVADDKKDIPDAIASIIGTVSTDEDKATTSKDIQVSKQEIKSDTNNEKTKTKQRSSTETSKDSQTKSKEQDSATTDAENQSESQNRKDVTFSDEDTQSAKCSDGEFEDDPDAMTSGELDEKLDPIQEEETRLQNFEKPDEEKLNQQVERMKEVIHKLQDGIDRELSGASPKLELKEVAEPKKESEIKPDAEIKKEVEPIKKESEPKEEPINEETPTKSEGVLVKETIKPEKQENQPEPLVPKVMIINMNSKNILKLKRKSKSKHEGRSVKKTKKVVDTLKSKLENMQMQLDAMQAQIQMKDQALQLLAKKELLESGGKVPEWCCKWYNGEPVGTVVDSEPDSRAAADASTSAVALPRKTIQVQDKRLPEGWKKLMVRRSLGHSAGKWDVVLVSPENRRIHTKSDMRNYIEASTDTSIRAYEHALMDFAIHLKEARRLGWVAEDGKHTGRSLLRGVAHKRGKVKDRSRLKHKDRKGKRRKLAADGRYTYDRSLPGTSDQSLIDSSAVSYDNSTLEDGYVYVGSLKVQVIDNLLRCPAEGCFKNFRNNTLLQMHIKHYHRDMRKMLGDTPKVLDLAYARTAPVETETKPRHEPDNKIIKVKFPRPLKREDTRTEKEVVDPRTEVPTPKFEPNKIPRSLDSPIMRQMQNRPVKRPKVLLPVRRPDPVDPPPEIEPTASMPYMDFDNSQLEPKLSEQPFDILDFETAISTHTVTRPPKKLEKVYGTSSNAPLSEDDEVLSMNSDVETRSSFPRSGSPDWKATDMKSTIQGQPMQPAPNDESAMYVYTETGERIKIERMKREEIINCHCGYREEDGLMVQCELCLCWQHAHCCHIQSEADVPKKYTCYICLNPRRGRRSQRHLQDQDRMTEGLLPGGRPSEALRRSHDISAYLLKLLDVINALRLKYHVATKKNHPKLYLWASDWDAQSDNQTNLPGFINNTMGIGKENMPLHTDDEADRLDMRTPDNLDDRLSQGEGSIGNSSLLGGLLSSPGGPSLEMPISTSELEKLASSVEEQELRPVFRAPQPEAAIDNAECLQNLLSHMRRCEMHLHARLDKLEADIAEIEAQDPMFEDDESPDSFPRTKKTIQMLMRDLETMELLGALT